MFECEIEIDPKPKPSAELANRTACQQKPATPSTPKAAASEHSDIPRSLWDEAYDSLKNEKPKTLVRYEELLSQVLKGMVFMMDLKTRCTG